jgi:aldose sugar dehydrogenase
MRALHFFQCSLVCFLAATASVSAKSIVDAVYRENCASCHGAELEAGSGGALADGLWKHGGSDHAIADSIAAGIPDAGMPAYGKTLSPEVIRSLVVYIREKESTFQAKEVPPVMPVGVVKTQRGSFVVETVLASGLETPWALAFLPDGRKLVTERPGRLRVIDASWNLVLEPVNGTPQVVQSNQGGLLDVVPAPDFASSGWIYLSYAAPLPRGEPASKSSMTKISRGRLIQNRWVDEETIFEADPVHFSTSGVHFGSRLVFDRGDLYFSIGDRGQSPAAQDIAAPNGKILRLHSDGSIPADNPFATRIDALAAVWSYGHRNPQGLVVDPRSHEIYDTEHGPRGGDEFNLIRKGANFGWPLVCFGMNYDGSPLTALTELDGIDAPLYHWTPSIATCGLAFYIGDKFPDWTHDYFVGGLRAGGSAGPRKSGCLQRLRIRAGKVIEAETIFEGLGRVRDVRCGPDGLIYVVLNQPDSIIRLVPVLAEPADPI